MLERLFHELTRLVGGLPPPALGEPQADHRPDELLLGAVVQIAAEPAALLVAGLDAREAASCSRASTLASAAVTSSAKSASRLSAPSGKARGRPLDATMAPHTLPAT